MVVLGCRVYGFSLMCPDIHVQHVMAESWLNGFARAPITGMVSVCYLVCVAQVLHSLST